MTIQRTILAATLALAALSGTAPAATVNGTGNVTNSVIFGSGSANGSFTGVTVGGLELGLRAKLRYDATSGCTGGFGCPQNVFNYSNASTYTFASAASHAPTNRSIFNFEWSINSNSNGSGSALNAYSYRIDIDTNPTTNVGGVVSYNPMSLFSTGYYLGTNASPAGGALFRPGGTGNLASFNLAQNSVNLGFLPGTMLGSGQFRISLSAFHASSGSLVASTAINVIVDAPAPVPLPAGLPLLAAALGGLVSAKKRLRRNRTA